MNKQQYRTARRMIRDNGGYALRWMTEDDAAVMRRVMIERRNDPIADRAELFESMGWGIMLAKSLARGIASQRSFETPEEIAKCLSSKGYRTWFDGRSVHVSDPVYSSRPGNRLVLTGHRDVVIHTMTDARRFIDARS